MINNRFENFAGQSHFLCLWPYGLIFMGASLAYLLGAAPVIGWRDGPEFVETAAYLDIAHPSGFPVFSLMAKPATWIPLASLGFRVTIFDALASALSLCLLVALIRMMLNRPDGRPVPAAENRAKFFAALAGAVFLGLSPSFWASATEVEVYTLNLCFIALLFICALKWSDGGGEKWLMAGGFLYGLSLGNHAALVLYAPALFAYVFLGSPVKNEKPGAILGRLAWLAFFFFLGLSVYVYLPLRAWADPPLNFGDPRNWDNFWFHLSDRKDAETHFGAARGFSLFLTHLHRYFTQAVNIYYLLFGLPLMIWGWLWAFKNKRALAVAALVLILINSLFFIEWVDGTGLFPTYFLAFVFTSAGLYRLWLWGWNSRRRAALGRPVFVGTLVGLLAVFTSVMGFNRLSDRYRHGSFLAVEAFWDDQANLPPGAVIYDVSFAFVSLAYATIYQLRPDVTRIMLSGVADFQGFSPLRPGRYPLAVIIPPDPRNTNNTLYARRLTYANFDFNIPVFAELNSSSLNLFATSLKPYGFFYYQVATSPEAMKNAARDGQLSLVVQRWLAKLDREAKQEGLLRTDRISGYYVVPLIDLASLLKSMGNPGLAEKLMDLMYEMMGPHGANMIDDKMMINVNMEMALILDQLGRLSEARSRLEANLALLPNHYPSLALLADYHRRAGDCERAASYYQQAWNLRRGYNELLIMAVLNEGLVKGWAECLSLMGRPAEAHRLLVEEGFSPQDVSPEAAGSEAAPGGGRP